MTTQELNSRLTALFDAHKQTLHLINRLAKLPSQPGTGSLNPDSTDARIELGAEIHQSLKEQEEDFELLRQEIEDHTSSSLTTAARRKDSEREKVTTDLLARVSRLGENLSTSAFHPAPFEPYNLTLNYSLVHEASFERLNFMRSVTQKLPKERKESCFSQAFKTVTVRIATLGGEVTRIFRKKICWSMLPATLQLA